MSSNINSLHRLQVDSVWLRFVRLRQTVGADGLGHQVLHPVGTGRYVLPEYEPSCDGAQQQGIWAHKVQQILSVRSIHPLRYSSKRRPNKVIMSYQYLRFTEIFILNGKISQPFYAYSIILSGRLYLKCAFKSLLTTTFA